MLLTGVGIGATALIAVFEAAAISHMVSLHLLELIQAGDYTQVMSDVVSGSVNGAADTASTINSGASGSSDAVASSADAAEGGEIPK